MPFFYAPEVWTGIEYQVASHMIYHGLVDEALTIVKAARDRHDGFRRNPWNEYECGSYYARALAIYGVFQALSGFRYCAVEHKVRIDPRLPDAKMASFFSTASGWGKFTVSRPAGRTSVTFEVEEGSLPIRHLVLPLGGSKGRSGKKGSRTICAAARARAATASVKGVQAQATCAAPGDAVPIGSAEVTLSKTVTVRPGQPVTVELSS